MNMDLWKDCDNIILWGVEHALAYNLLDVLQHQNVYALVPNNELKQALKKKLEEQNFEGSLKIEQAHLNDKDGEATLREFSLPQMNSLKAPSGILDIYPGLKQLQMQSVKCLSPSSLLVAYELTDQMDNTLWLEINGQITSTIQGLIESETVYLFTRILVFMPKQAWYEPEVGAEALIQKLKQVGYDASNQIVGLDSDQGLYEFTRHPLVLEKKALECEVERLRMDTVEYQKQLETKAQQVAELSTERNEQSRWCQENKKWVEGLKQELSVSTQQKNTIEQQLTQLQVKQNELVESHKSKDANIVALTQKNTTLKQEKDELIFRQTILDTEIVKVEAQLELVKDVVLREKSF